ncbi:Hypothetical protein PHPALM_5561 [Phytophthora palmivora]|uniref:Chromo domain-containing protein n=1 Tax=Phytophthora palmivora TaxID=4796 RepID=A0A2P4YH20_9STRA|nr:Hypothetical protein PHPALM_5561 [Phytophthora palmivora]
MSEVFQKYAEKMQSRSRATRSYRPQASGQQERSVKTMIQTVRVYVEDPLHADWDDIAEKMVYAINNSRDSTRQETPFYLLGMVKIARIQGKMNSAHKSVSWVRKLPSREYQLKEKARRAKEHNESLSRVEQRATPQGRSNSETAESGGAPAESMGTTAESMRLLFKEGDQVWLFMERVRQGLTKKLAHRWHGPFRVKRKVEEFAYELELPDKSGYRPTTRLVAQLEEDQRFDFDEELLPEDSWEPDEGASQYEVEAILDDELPLSTSTTRNERKFEVKWVGYEEPSWEPLSNLSCGGLLFDYLRQKKRVVWTNNYCSIQGTQCSLKLWWNLIPCYG